MTGRLAAPSPIDVWINVLHPFFISNCFQQLLPLATYDPVVLPLAECAVTILFVLIAARFLCINCGKYFYYFTEEMHI